MKGKWKGFSFLLMFFVLFAVANTNGMEVQAASKAANAKKAYNRFLSNIYDQKDFSWIKELGGDYGSTYFIVKDISGDKVPELIVKQDYTAPCSYYIYTYKNGNVKKLKELSFYNGGEVTHIYPTKHIVVAYEGDDWSSGAKYYRVYNSKIKLVAKEIDGKYYLNGKKVSKSKFNQYVQKLNKSKCYSVNSGKLKFRKNTQKNRKKYIK